jgi:hypothetical protein
MEVNKQSINRKFVLWEIAIAKFAVVIAVLLSLVLFLFSNLLSDSFAGVPVTFIGALKYALSSFVGVFSMFSVLNVFGSLIALIRLQLKS